jgi:hypothetical protein
MRAAEEWAQSRYYTQSIGKEIRVTSISYRNVCSVWTLKGLRGWLTWACLNWVVIHVQDKEASLPCLFCPAGCRWDSLGHHLLPPPPSVPFSSRALMKHDAQKCLAASSAIAVSNTRGVAGQKSMHILSACNECVLSVYCTVSILWVPIVRGSVASEPMP